MNTLGYGRYKDDPNHVGCPRAKTDMTPCVARDGSTACTDDGVCVGCGEHPADLLTALVHEATKQTDTPAIEASLQQANTAAGEVTFRIPGLTTERFARDAFANQIGKTVPITGPHGRGTGRLLAVEVVDSGRAVLLTLEVDETTARPLHTVDRGHYSIGYTPSNGVTIKPISAIESSSQTDEENRFEGQDGGGPDF